MKINCTFPGCNKRIRTRGYCDTHYCRLRRNGKIQRLPKLSMKERFMENVEMIPESGCWVWMGNIDIDGYGRFCVGHIMKRAHRISYELYVDNITKGLNVLHRCDTPSCVNPYHLFLGTIADNNHDCIRKNRHVTTRGEQKGTSKLKEAQVIKILKDPRRQSQIANEYKVSQSQISLIKLGKEWKHIYRQIMGDSKCLENT